MPGPTDVRKHGLGFDYESGSVRLLLTRLRERSGEATGRLEVGHEGRVMSLGQFTVSSPTARGTLAKSLTADNATVPWKQHLEVFCQGVLRQADLGSGVVVLNGHRGAVRPPLMPVLPPLLYYHQPTVIYGAGEAGKSTLGAAMLVALSTGVATIPGMQPSPMVCEVWDWESDAADWEEKMEFVARGAGTEPGEVFYEYQERPLWQQVERLAAGVQARGTEVVIVDSVMQAMGAGGEHQDAADGAIRLFQALRQIGATFILFDHVRGDAMGEDTVVNRPYGSVVKYNSVRSAFEMKREPHPAQGRAEVLLTNTKRNRGQHVPPLGLLMVYGEDTIRFERTEVTAPGLKSSLPLWLRMRDALKFGMKATRELAEEVDASPAAISSEASRRPEVFSKPGRGYVGLSTNSTVST